MSKRRPPKQGDQIKILIESRRRCCVCFGLSKDFGLKKGQIGHIDGNPANNAANNLAFLCLDHHDDLDSRTSQSKGLTSQEVLVFKNMLSERIRRWNAEQISQGVEETTRKRTHDFLGTSESADSLLAMFGEPLDSGDESLSTFGKWRRIFNWHGDDKVKAGLFTSNNRLIFFYKEAYYLYRPGDSDVSEMLKIDPAQRIRSASYLAATGTIAAYGRESGNIAIWEMTFDDDDDDLAEDHERVVLVGHKVSPTAAEFDVNSGRFASADRSGGVILWDWRQGRQKGKVYSVVPAITSVSFFPNPVIDRLIVNNMEGEFEVLDMSGQSSLGRSKIGIKGEHAAVWFTAFPDHIIGEDEFERRDIVDGDTLEAVEKEKWFGTFISNCVSDQQRVNACKNATGQAWLFEKDRPEDATYASIDIVPSGPGAITSMSISGDGRLFAAVMNKRQLCVWERLDAQQK